MSRVPGETVGDIYMDLSPEQLESKVYESNSLISLS